MSEIYLNTKEQKEKVMEEQGISSAIWKFVRSFITNPIKAGILAALIAGMIGNEKEYVEGGVDDGWRWDDTSDGARYFKKSGDETWVIMVKSGKVISATKQIHGQTSDLNDSIVDAFKKKRGFT